MEDQFTFLGDNGRAIRIIEERLCRLALKRKNAAISFLFGI